MPISPSCSAQTRGSSVVPDDVFATLAWRRVRDLFERLALLTVGALRALGLALEPTGRSPRHYDVTFDDLDDGVEELENCEHQIMANPYHEG